MISFTNVHKRAVEDFIRIRKIPIHRSYSTISIDSTSEHTCSLPILKALYGGFQLIGISDRASVVDIHARWWWLKL